MALTGNYRIQAQQANARFLTYNPEALAAKLRAKRDQDYLYVNLLCQSYRLNLATGDPEKRVGEVWVDGGSYEEIMASLKRLGELEGDFHVCPGHDRTSTLERERKYNPFLLEAMGAR